MARNGFRGAVLRVWEWPLYTLTASRFSYVSLYISGAESDGGGHVWMCSRSDVNTTRKGCLDSRFSSKDSVSEKYKDQQVCARINNRNKIVIYIEQNHSLVPLRSYKSNVNLQRHNSTRRFKSSCRRSKTLCKTSNKNNIHHKSVWQCKIKRLPLCIFYLSVYLFVYLFFVGLNSLRWDESRHLDHKTKNIPFFFSSTWYYYVKEHDMRKIGFISFFFRLLYPRYHLHKHLNNPFISISLSSFSGYRRLGLTLIWHKTECSIFWRHGEDPNLFTSARHLTGLTLTQSATSPLMVKITQW